MSPRERTRFTRCCGKILIAIVIGTCTSGAVLAQDVITGTIEIIRAGSVGNRLHVSDMIEIQNRSPRTRAGEHNFDVYLPARAKISSVLAAGPGNVAMMIPATPTPGDPGHYSVTFPLQPGATKFAFNYDIPYDGKAAFQIRHAYALQQLAVMIPPTMQFSSNSAAFKTLETGNKSYRVRAIAQLNAGPGPAFEISGSGSLPSIRASIPIPTQPAENTEAKPISPVRPMQNSAAANTALRPTSAQSSAANPNSLPAQIRPSTPTSWMFLGTLGLGLFAMSAAAIRRASVANRTVPRKIMRIAMSQSSETRPYKTQAPTFLLEGLKEELFQLETAKIRGTISTKDYDLTRSALEETVKRALSRAS
jgi:hypothetical protein